MLSRISRVLLVVVTIALLTSPAWATPLAPITMSGLNADVLYGPDAGNGGGFNINPAFSSDNSSFYVNGAKQLDGTAPAGGFAVGNFGSALDATRIYCLAPAGGLSESDNALRIQGDISTNVHSGTLTLATPGYYDAIGVIGTTASGSGFNYSASHNLVLTFNFAGGSYSSTYVQYDWTDTSTAAVAATACSLPGRAKGTSATSMNNTFTSVDAHVTSLFETVIAIPPEYQSQSLQSITFYGMSGTDSNNTYRYQYAGTLVMGVSGHAIPEPGTLALLAAGLVGLLCYAWRKRK